jgi:hypothetical protein
MVFIHIQRCPVDIVAQNGNVLIDGDRMAIDVREIKELAKAEFIRGLLEQGVDLADALRDLTQRMRRMREGRDGDSE